MSTPIVKAVLSNRLEVFAPSLPSGVEEYLIEALSIPNVAREEAKRQHQWGWERMPEKIELWEKIGDRLILPRGFATAFADGMRAVGAEIMWSDMRTFERLSAMGNEISARPYQVPAINSMIELQQGFYKAPAGSGKTVSVLAVIQQLAVKSIVIVNTKDIMWQWRDRAREYLGEDYPLGQIGDNVFEVSDYLTIATAQTLHSKFEALKEDGFFNEFSFVCLDEAHHATADTYNRVVNEFSARYRLGVSATPDKTGDFALATNVLGPIIHETRPNQVPNLTLPDVIRVPTKFGFGFRSTQSRWQRSNYPQMISALIRDRDRNELIASLVKKEEGHHSLLISKRLEHLDLLEAMIMDMDYDGHLLRLTGKESREERQRVVQIANSEPSLLFSTLADEALDVPRLDRMFLPFPQKNPGLVTQQVGRVERVHPDKADAKIYDFYDGNVGPLDSQWRTRRFEVYEPRGYKITTMRKEKENA